MIAGRQRRQLHLKATTCKTIIVIGKPTRYILSRFYIPIGLNGNLMTDFSRNIYTAFVEQVNGQGRFRRGIILIGEGPAVYQDFNLRTC